MSTKKQNTQAGLNGLKGNEGGTMKKQNTNTQQQLGLFENTVNEIKGGVTMTTKQQNTTKENQGGKQMETKAVDPRVKNVIEAIRASENNKGLKGLIKEINPKEEKEVIKPVRRTNPMKEALRGVKIEKVVDNYEDLFKEGIRNQEREMALADIFGMIGYAGDLKQAEIDRKTEEEKARAKAEEEAKLIALEEERFRVAGILESEGLLIEAQRLMRGEVTPENYNSMVAKVDRAKSILVARINRVYKIKEKKAEDKRAKQEAIKTAKVETVRNYAGTVGDKLAESGISLADEAYALVDSVTYENAEEVNVRVRELEKIWREANKNAIFYLGQMTDLLPQSARGLLGDDLDKALEEVAKRGGNKVDLLTGYEIEVLTKVLYHAKECSKYNKFAFIDRKNIDTRLRNEFGIVDDIKVRGFRYDLIYSAYNTVANIELPKLDIDVNYQTLVDDLKSPLLVEEMKALSLEETVKVKLAEEKLGYDRGVWRVNSKNLRSCLIAINRVLNKYNSSVVSLSVNTYIPEGMTLEEAKGTIDANGKCSLPKLEKRIKLIADSEIYGRIKRWCIEIPLIEKSGRYETVNSVYYCSYISYNTSNVISKRARLLAEHPISYLMSKALSKYEGGELVPLDQDEFNEIVDVSSGAVWVFENKIKDIMRKARQNINSNDLVTPLLWVPKTLSKVGQIGRENTVYFDWKYTQLAEIEDYHIEGLDYFTGSTSEPAKRATVSAGYYLQAQENGLFAIAKRLESKSSNAIIATNESQGYLARVNLFTTCNAKTSGKRNNGSTISSTYELVKPQMYQRYCRNPLVGVTGENTFNHVLRKALVAKINLPETLCKELVEIEEIYPNTNDCFLVSSEFAKLMATYYAKAHEEVREVVMANGDKMIGSYRDKGSISSILEKYKMMVDFEVRSLSEADQFIKTLKQLRGEDTPYSFDEKTLKVTCEVDVVANPSTGRDNVGALLQDSELEKQAMLAGEVRYVTTEDAAKMDVRKVVSKSIQSHHVYLCERETDEVKFDFGTVAIMFEDFFWQPQHSNADYMREKNISTFYNQGIAGFASLSPVLYECILNSFKGDLMKQTLVYSNLGLFPEANNYTSKEILENASVKTADAYIADVGFDDDDDEEEVSTVPTAKVELSKFNLPAGVIRQLDPEIGVDAKVYDKFVKENVSYMDESHILTQDKLAYFIEMLQGKSGRLLKELLYSPKKQNKKIESVIKLINGLYEFRVEYNGKERVFAIPVGSEDKVEYFNKPEPMAEETELKPLFGDDEDDECDEMSSSELEAYNEAERNGFELDENKTKYDWYQGTVLDYTHMELLNLAISYYYFKEASEEEKAKREKAFLKKARQFQNQLLKPFSKDWKNMYDWQMRGLTGVILPSKYGIDEVELPKWFCKKHKLIKGSAVLAFRDPIQGLYLTLRLAGFTKGEIRIHSKVLTWLGGDHDGDKLQVVPVETMFRRNAKYIKDLATEEALRREINGLTPSCMLDNPKFSSIFAEKDLEFKLDDKNYSNTLLSLLDESKKSSKFYAPVEMKDFFGNLQTTVLNMRTVKEGTAEAGSFGNKIFDIADQYGLDLLAVRFIADRVQQLALDSKHDQGGKGYKASAWNELTTYFSRCCRFSFSMDSIRAKLVETNEKASAK